MNKEIYKEKFIELYTRYVKRDGADELLKWIENSDFFTAPASTKFHEVYEGGLCEHSIRVFNELARLVRAYPEVKVNVETAVIVSLLHDLCKVGCYKIELRNKKENGVWVQVPFYTFDEDFSYGGHGSKSVYLIQKYMKLTDEEATAINCHMGPASGENSIFDAFRQYPLSFLLHTADMASTITTFEERK